MHFVANDSLKLDNVINTCLISPYIISYYSLWLNICEYLIY